MSYSAPVAGPGVQMLPFQVMIRAPVPSPRMATAALVLSIVTSV